MTPLVHRGQRQPGQGPHRPIRAEHRVGQLEQLIIASGQALVKLTPELRQHGGRLDTAGAVLQAVHHGLRL
jgi:hypothetical protein